MNDKEKAQNAAETMLEFLKQFGDKQDDYTKIVLEVFFEELLNASISISDTPR